MPDDLTLNSSYFVFLKKKTKEVKNQDNGKF